MYALPKDFKAELHKRYDFTQEFNDKTALFHPLEEGRFLICIPPPLAQGLPELLVNKVLGAKAETIVLILPADTSTDWFHKVWDEYQKNSSRLNLEFTKRLKWEEGGTDKVSRWKNRIATVLICVRNC